VRAVGAVEDDFAERRRVGKRAVLRLAADGTQPFLPGVNPS
jgi:hypothetical protein